MAETDPGAKALVFSQFVNMLDLLEYRIQVGGIRCVKLLGHMNINERDATIKKFQNDVSTRVLLISLKAGGMALNLTSANYVSSTATSFDTPSTVYIIISYRIMTYHFI